MEEVKHRRTLKGWVRKVTSEGILWLSGRRFQVDYVRYQHPALRNGLDSNYDRGNWPRGMWELIDDERRYMLDRYYPDSVTGYAEWHPDPERKDVHVWIADEHEVPQV